MTNTAETLNEALASLGITSVKAGADAKSLYAKSLYRDGKHIGDFTASEGWKLVHELRADEFEAGNAAWAASFAS
jgi:predicted amidohydrolase YtcJ